MSTASDTVVYEYNASGLRVKKIATSTGTTNYTLHGKNIVHLTNGNDELHFYYDASDKPAMVEYNGMMYAYVHNLQGDIVAILDDSGATVVRYTYDAWGKPLSCTGTLAASLGKLNPFRYRGYVYDEETGLYYLCSRYYHPWRGRFMNVDKFIGKGLVSSVFAYCNNSPGTLFDPNGTSPHTAIYSVCLDDLSAPYEGTLGEYILSIVPPDIKRKEKAIWNCVYEFDAYVKQNWLGNNGVGKIANTAVSGASNFLAIKISAYCAAAAGPAGFVISLLLTIPIAFLGKVAGQIIENDLRPDNRFGGEMDQSDPMGIVYNGLVNSVSPLIPSSPNKFSNILRRMERRLIKKFVEKTLE